MIREFDVATVRPSNPNMPGRQFMAKGHQFLTINTTLNDLITFAYGLNARQVMGAPAWAASEKYDLDGKVAGESQPNDAQWKIMIQKLLVDRFQLTFHREPERAFRLRTHRRQKWAEADAEQGRSRLLTRYGIPWLREHARQQCDHDRLRRNDAGHGAGPAND